MSGIAPFAAFVTGGILLTVGLSKALDMMFEDDLKTDENDGGSVLKKMKQLKNELSRLLDIKKLNDKLESTGQINKTTIQIEGVEINELISALESELTRLTKKYQEMNTKKPKRK